MSMTENIYLNKKINNGYKIKSKNVSLYICSCKSCKISYRFHKLLNSLAHSVC